MSPTVRVRVRFNVGDLAPIETVAGAVRDLDTLCQLGGRLQDMAARNIALRALAAGGIPWLRDDDLEDVFYRRRPGYPVWPLEALASPNLERQLAIYLREYDLDRDGIVLVDRLSYANPVDATLITAAGGVVLTLLRVIRDWDSRRRIATGRARIAEAQAEDYEDQVALRKEARLVIRQALLTGDQPLRPDQIDALLTSDVLDATRRLASSGLSLEEDETDGPAMA